MEQTLLNPEKPVQMDSGPSGINELISDSDRDSLFKHGIWWNPGHRESILRKAGEIA